MKDKTDNLLILLLIIAVGISMITGLFISSRLTIFSPITGFATGNANASVNLSITTVAGLSFVDNIVDWGSGSVNMSSGTNCTMDTLDTTTALSTTCQGFNVENTGLSLENIGNQDLVVTLVSNATAAQFIGDPSAVFKWNITENEGGACLNSTGGYGVNITAVDFENVADSTAFSDGKVICPNLSYITTKNSLNISLNITIPYTAPSGYKIAKITAVGTSL